MGLSKAHPTIDSECQVRELLGCDWVGMFIICMCIPRNTQPITMVSLWTGPSWLCSNWKWTYFKDLWGIWCLEINSFLLQSKVNYSHFSLAFVVPLWGCGWYVWDEWKFWYPWIHPAGRHEPLNCYVSLRVDCIFEGGIRTMRDWHKLAYSIGLPNHEL